MARPATRPSNANKHPGQVVLDASRVQCPREEVAAEKSRKQAKKTAKAAATKNAQIRIASKEDTMAIEQRAQLAGPAQLVRPRPRPVAKKTVSTLKNAVTASSAEMQSELSQVDISSRNDVPKKSHPSLKLMFKDGVNANRKIPNSGVSDGTSSVTRVGSTNNRTSGKPFPAPSTAATLLEGPVKDWAKKVASKSQLKPSAPPSARSVKGNDDIETFDIQDDAPEEFDHHTAARLQDGKGVVHTIVETNDGVQCRGRKRTLSVAENSDQGHLALEEQQEVQEDPDADLDQDADSDYKSDEDVQVDQAGVGDIDGDVDVDAMAVDQLEPGVGQQDDSVSDSEALTRFTTSMSVDVADNRTTKYIKTEDERMPAPLASQARSLSLNLNKKRRAKNSQLPDSVYQSWRSRYIPALVFWVGNSHWPWTISDEDLSNALYEIHNALRKDHRVIEFDVDTPGFELASQRIHEWRASFGSTAVTILMAIFTSMGDDYKTEESRQEYAEYLLDGLRFVYENPDSEEHPGAFLSEFILRIFATHLNAIQGNEKVDTLDTMMPGHQTALALTTAAAERALTLARDGLILDCEPSDNMKKTCKIALTLNKTTNKMSSTGTAFSATNWETETIAYLNLIDQLEPSRIKEIVVRAQPFMKRTGIRNMGHTSDAEGPAKVVDPRSRIRICSVIFSASQFSF